MENKKNYTTTKTTKLVSRRDYSKTHSNYVEDDLLKIQKQAYKKFLTEDLEAIFENFKVIKHPKNESYEIKLGKPKLVPSKWDEETARNEGKTYEQSLYVDVAKINHITGQVETIKRGKKSVSDGIFFGNIPMMTSKGTFIINGIEKFVISQIIRSPGAYVLTKSQIKLNNKKKVIEGHVIELLPSHGPLLNFWISQKDEDRKIVNVSARNTTGDNAPTFSGTMLLRALGIGQSMITTIFPNNPVIINTLIKDLYNRQNIFQDDEINSFRKTVVDNPEKNVIKSGMPLDRKLRVTIAQYVRLNSELQSIEKYKKQHEKALDEDKSLSHSKEYLDLENKHHELTKELTRLIDTIVTEKTAKHLIELFNISTKVIESNVSDSDENIYSYQDVFCDHFFSQKYSLSSAGRYKLNHKLRISERLYQQTLANDILDNNGKVVLKAGTVVLKEELETFKKYAQANNLKIAYNVPHASTKSYSEFEMVEVLIEQFGVSFPTPIIGLKEGITSLPLTMADLISIISYAINLPHGIGQYDDIDHLSSKRLRLINEQLRNKLLTGMGRVEKNIKDKLASLSIATANEETKEKADKKTTIRSLINTKPFQQVIKAFFNIYQLTQFIDQQNPLSELTNKRRISAMGDGGISREDPNLDIRDVHYSHYGRICPIETPEGANIGLIMSLASFAEVDSNGFLLTPYRKVKNGIITDEVDKLTALKEENFIIAESAVPLKTLADGTTKIDTDKVVARYRSNQELYDVNRIDYIDVSPRQVVSIAAGSIPFLENNDTTRALMGANMQRQATPLIKPIAPVVGTGTEYRIARDSGMAVVSENDGVVSKVDGNKIVVKTSTGDETYKLIKYNKSNQNTCNSQKPIVNLNDVVKKGDVIGDGPAMHNGELALGRNPLVAFMTWGGYNFEDAIIISERLANTDVYTSIHINEYTVECVRTKVGDEQISRDIPNVSKDATKYLDEDGIIMIGAEVKEGDVLVGKITPQANQTESSENELLKILFGIKANAHKDSSLRVPHGGEGVVAAVKRFSLTNGNDLNDNVIELLKVFVVQKRKIQVGDKMAGRHGNKGIVSKVVPVEDMPHLEDGTPIDIMLNPLGVPSRMNIGQIMEVHLGLAMLLKARDKMLEIASKEINPEDLSCDFGLDIVAAKNLINFTKKYFSDNKLTNKSKDEIDSIHVSIILNTLGYTLEDLNFKAATPVFNGANLNDVSDALSEVGIAVDKTKAKFRLIDGRTGEYFDNPITVGVMYMLKLDHMVDDKIHARAVGPYSKITQQPLGGRSQIGGQRFGEMEVWALEAYGAAYNLKEILTIKSDDIKGRNLTYSSIVKGKELPSSSIPESFKLLTKQLQGLCLGINVIDENGKIKDINTISSLIDESEKPVENSSVVSKNVTPHSDPEELEEHF